MSEEEESPMKEKNKPDAPRWVLKPYPAFLTALHVLVLVLSLAAHPPIETGAL
jgi:hypothetical protein